MNTQNHDRNVLLDEAVRCLLDEPVDEQSLAGALADTRQALHEAMRAEAGGVGSRTVAYSKWRQIMSNRMTKFAIAAAVVIAFVGLGSWLKLSNGKSGIAFADVLRNVQSAHSVQFKGVTTVQVPGLGVQTITSETIIVEEPNRMRQTISPSGTGMPGGMVMIWDLREGRCLTLDPQNKRATVMEMSNMPPEQKAGNLLEQFRQLSGTAGTPIGEKEIAGRMTKGFKVVAGPMEMLIWADTQTRLPVQIEATMKFGMLPAGSTTETDFVWDQEVDESLVSLTPPAGYELGQTIKLNLGPATEQEVIDALKTLAELNGGKFPASLSLDFKSLSGFMKKSKSLKNLKTSQGDPAQLKEFEATMVQLTTAITRAWIFISDPKNGEDFRYAGKDVSVGQAGTPVFWYQPKDSATYRVIDADLTVRDVLPADLPTVPSTPLRPKTGAAEAQPPQQ